MIAGKKWKYMLFRICEQDTQILYRWNVVQLHVLKQNDEGFETAFDMTYYDSYGRRHHFGIVKIGKCGMKPGKIRDFIPDQFQVLPKGFFSLGQDEDYYDQIKQQGDSLRHALLQGLRDVAYNTELLRTSLTEAVMTKSLLCNVVIGDDADHKKAVAKIEGQLNRMAEHGGARLTDFHFQYKAPKPKDPSIQRVTLNFKVTPESNPPTNVHAMIGRNGCGKTYLIHNMVQCLQARTGDYGEFIHVDKTDTSQDFANLVCIAFSPFDSFPEAVKEKRDIPAVFVGLNEQVISTQSNIPMQNRLIDAISGQFWEYLHDCMITSQRRLLWKEAITILQTGFGEFEREIFEEIQLLMKEMDEQYDEGEFQKRRTAILDVFKRLSSGHKVVLLTITSCVAEIEERSILFLDEPENHLHPPLLSALIRALSDLLRKRNGVAIISTHSPVVLQEVPKSCVWLLTRNGVEDVKPERLKRETFGTSLGTLIDEAFSFEVNESGFHKLMEEAAEKYRDFDEALIAYRGQLGDEAAILLRMLLPSKRRGGKNHGFFGKAGARDYNDEDLPEMHQ